MGKGKRVGPPIRARLPPEFPSMDSTWLFESESESESEATNPNLFPANKPPGEMDADDETHSLSPSQLLQLAEHHLRLRNYSLSSQYAVESLHSDPSDSPLRRRSSLILAVSDVLFASSQTLGSSPNWYSVLGVDTFCTDQDSIRSKSKSLHLLLDPLRPEFPIANEAMKSAWTAWMVLSNPDKKSELDADLGRALATERSSGETFWTSCPYCYCIYEYAAVYEGFCLRCQNLNCRRAFHGASISSTPPAGLKQGDHFDCFGCFPLGFSQMQEASGNSNFGPFVSMFPTEAPTDSGDEQARSGNAVPRVEPHIPGGRMMRRKSVGVNRGRMSQIVKKTDLGEARGTRYEYQDNWDDDDDDDDDDEYVVDADVEFVEKDGKIFVQLPP